MFGDPFKLTDGRLKNCYSGLASSLYLLKQYVNKDLGQINVLKWSLKQILLYNEVNSYPSEIKSKIFSEIESIPQGDYQYLTQSFH